MIKEHDPVILAVALDEPALQPGDVGVVVDVHAGGVAYEVEFMTLAGGTVAVVTLEAGQVRPISADDMPHARALGSTRAA